MNAAARWTLYGSLGALGGVLTYFVAVRWFPYVTLRDLVGPMPKEGDPKALVDYFLKAFRRPPLTTLGTTYGNVAYFLLGATVCGGIVGALRWERHGAAVGLGWAFLAFFLGGAVVRALDAASDLFVRSLGFEGNFVPEIFWSLLIGMGMALTIGLLQGPTGPRLRRAAIAGLVAGIAGSMMHGALAPLGGIGSFESLRGADRRTMEVFNLWEPSRWLFLIEYVSMGAALGLAFAYVESNLRKGSLRLGLGANEGEEWELAGGPVMIGSAEASGIRIPARLGVAPRHASIVPHTEHGYALAPEPGQTIAVNGRPTGGEWLRHGDRIGLGRATLVYREPNAPRDEATPAKTLHWLEISDGRKIELGDGVAVLGNQPGHEVSLPFPGVAARHAEIRIAKGRATLGDLGAPGGTRVEGTPVTTRILADGDRIEIGPVQMRYREVVPRGFSDGRIG